MRLFVLAILISALVIMASASAYHLIRFNIQIEPSAPTATFVQPPLRCHIGRIQNALVYTDFDEKDFPPPDWTTTGGTWVRQAGHKGQAAAKTDSASGSGHRLYWTASISSYTSLWAAVKVLGGPVGAYKGIAFMNANLGSVYEIAIQQNSLRIRSYDGTWSTHAAASIPGGVNPNEWYTILAIYTVHTNPDRVVINAWAFFPYGTQATSTSATISGNRFFRPAYVGVHHVGTSGPRYDDFIASTQDPRTITFVSPVTVSVELWDDANNQVFTGSGTTFSVTVVRDIVLGRGYSNNSVSFIRSNVPCARYTGVVLGSDTYRVSTWTSYTATPAGTRASVTWVLNGVSVVNAVTTNISTTQPLYARLIFAENVGSLIGYTLELAIVGTTPSTPIVISGGSVNPKETSIVELNTNSKNYIRLKGSSTIVDQATLTLRFLLELCPNQAPPRGVCLYYPYELVINK